MQNEAVSAAFGGLVRDTQLDVLDRGNGDVAGYSVIDIGGFPACVHLVKGKRKT